MSDAEAAAYLRRRIDRLPAWIRHSIHWLRRPAARWLRRLAAIVLLIGGILWFLPLVGLWMLPLGLILLAEDSRALKRRLARNLMRCDGRRLR